MLFTWTNCQWIKQTDIEIIHRNELHSEVESLVYILWIGKFATQYGRVFFLFTACASLLLTFFLAVVPTLPAVFQQKIEGVIVRQKNKSIKKRAKRITASRLRSDVSKGAIRAYRNVALSEQTKERKRAINFLRFFFIKKTIKCFLPVLHHAEASLWIVIGLFFSTKSRQIKK